MLSGLLLPLLAGCVSAPPALDNNPFQVSVKGNFKTMMHSGDASAHALVGELPQGPGVWGVGAMRDLRGELIAWDGAYKVSWGSDHAGRTRLAKPADAVTLFISARVSGWKSIKVPRAMTQSQFESFVLEQAQANGLSRRIAFPFTVSGPFPELVWHVVDGMPASGHTGKPAKDGHAEAMKVHRATQAPGTILGFHGGPALEGIATHPGEYFHLHFATEEQTSSGHVDSYSIAQGAVLQLPIRP